MITRQTPGRARDSVLQRPRHVLLAASVAGLLIAGAVGAGGSGFAPAPITMTVAAMFAIVLAPRPALAGAAAAAVLVSAAGAQARLNALDRTALHPGAGAAVAVRAVALERPRRSSTGSRSALVRLVSGPGRGERILVRVRPEVRLPPLRPGVEVVVRGALRPLGRFDGHQRRRGAHAVLFAGTLQTTGARRGGVAGTLDRVRERAERGLGAGLGPPQAALAHGMVLGQDDGLSDPVRDAMRRSGLAHLTAASGQNVMLLAALALPLLALLGFGLRGRLCGALVLVAAYVPLAGGGPSIQRAGVMGAAGLVAALAGRPASRWYALLLAAFVTLAVNPRSGGDPGWQLSFAAVVAILALGTPLREALVGRRVPVAVAEAGAITIAATAATAPLLAFHFGQVSLVSLPANLLAVPAVAPVMWLGMISAAVAQASIGVASLPAAVAAYPLAYVEWLAQAAAAVPEAAVGVRVGSPAGVVAIYAGLGIATHLVVTVPRARPVVAAMVMALAAIGWLSARPPPPLHPHGLTVSFLDVGQGDATLIQHDRAAILVDAGPPHGPILERLRRAGVQRLDVLVITHAQADHEGGAAAVLGRIPVGLVLDGGSDGARGADRRAIEAAARRAGVRRVVPDAGQVVRAGPLTLRVLWPHGEAAALHAGVDPNDRAIVAHLRDGAFDLLLPADAESGVTAALDLPQVDVLKVAHHGSADPGLPDLLDRLRPSVAAIEVGEGNPYGHPTAQALGALAVVPRIYRTDRDGTIRVTVDAAGMHVVTDP